MPDPGLAPIAACLQCGTELAPSLRSCPGCHALVHADELKALARRAEDAEASGDLLAALTAWRRALELLPEESVQHRSVRERAAALSARIDGGEARSPSAPAEARPNWIRRAGPLGVLALLAWKLKFAFVFVLTKGKLLLLGLTKAGTFFSMLAALGVYWTAFGWPFALGLVLSIYVHEMGHVAALQRFGIAASAPMFIPGLRGPGTPEAIPGERRGGRPGGARRPALGPGGRPRRLRRVSRDGDPGVGRHRPHGGLDEPVQPDAGVAARRQPRLPRAVHAATAAGRDRLRRGGVRHRRRAADPPRHRGRGAEPGGHRGGRRPHAPRVPGPGGGLTALLKVQVAL